MWTRLDLFTAYVAVCFRKKTATESHSWACVKSLIIVLSHQIWPITIGAPIARGAEGSVTNYIARRNFHPYHNLQGSGGRGGKYLEAPLPSSQWLSNLSNASPPPPPQQLLSMLESLPETSPYMSDWVYVASSPGSLGRGKESLAMTPCAYAPVSFLICVKQSLWVVKST